MGSRTRQRHIQTARQRDTPVQGLNAAPEAPLVGASSHSRKVPGSTGSGCLQQGQQVDAPLAPSLLL